MKQLAVVLLKLPSGAYVFQRRTEDAPVNAGLLGFFGGHVNEGEGAIEAARRELDEETSLQIDELPFTPVDDFVVDREGEEVEYHLYEVSTESMDCEVYEGERAEKYTIQEALTRDDLTSSVKYTLEKIAKEQHVSAD